ncbi:MAG: HDIG domain-containing protein [Ignavibacteria bacterium]|jgi:putative nucleotidyltransferase with HDIG domain|nr:HDIG domain-containing protein [Ignavibacteria bacterium]MCU7502282.1 HDIG domain-containing protein [Ignavibacteria bacterium]MCU7516674.1 HDIG domain-containing protein [Ignavibacteria bacterium]
MREKVLEIWPEINWIQNGELREKVLQCWIYAIENSVLSAGDLEKIPFSLLLKDCKVSFMNHKRTCVQLAVSMARIMKENFGEEIKIDMDTLIAGAILIDIGKLLEYEMKDGKLTTSVAGKMLRHPFSGIGIVDRFGIPPEVEHIIATHSKEGDLGMRTVESIIVHHADFVSFDPFKA